MNMAEKNDVERLNEWTGDVVKEMAEMGRRIISLEEENVKLSRAIADLRGQVSVASTAHIFNTKIECPECGGGHVQKSDPAFPGHYWCINDHHWPDAVAEIHESPTGDWEAMRTSFDESSVANRMAEMMARGISGDRLNTIGEPEAESQQALGELATETQNAFTDALAHERSLEDPTFWWYEGDLYVQLGDEWILDNGEGGVTSVDTLPEGGFACIDPSLWEKEDVPERVVVV